MAEKGPQVVRKEKRHMGGSPRQGGLRWDHFMVQPRTLHGHTPDPICGGYDSSWSLGNGLDCRVLPFV